MAMTTKEIVYVYMSGPGSQVLVSVHCTFHVLKYLSEIFCIKNAESSFSGAKDLSNLNAATCELFGHLVIKSLYLIFSFFSPRKNIERVHAIIFR